MCIYRNPFHPEKLNDKKDLQEICGKYYIYLAKCSGKKTVYDNLYLQLLGRVSLAVGLVESLRREQVLKRIVVITGHSPQSMPLVESCTGLFDELEALSTSYCELDPFWPCAKSAGPESSPFLPLPSG